MNEKISPLIKKTDELAFCKTLQGAGDKSILKVGNITCIKDNAKSNNIKENSADIIGEGINPKISLTSKLFGSSVYTLEGKFFSKKKDGSYVSIDDFIKINNISDELMKGSPEFKGWFDNFIVPYRRKNDIFANRENLENAIGGQLGNQIPEINPINMSDNPEYVNVKNIPINVGFSKNRIENVKYEALLGYSLSDQKQQELEDSLKETGSFQTLLTLFGASKKQDVKGIFNNPAIVEMDASDVNALFPNGAKSITDIIRSGVDPNYNEFKRKLQLIKDGRLPEAFSKASGYWYSYQNNAGMQDMVIVCPVSDYSQLKVREMTNYVGGEIAYRPRYETELGVEIGCDIVPLGVCDADAKSAFGYGDYALDPNGQYNTYFIYDRAKLNKFITLPIVKMFQPSVSNYGTTLNQGYFGATTDVFSFDTIVGFKIKVPR